MSEILFIIIMLGGLLVPSALFHRWTIFWVFLAFGIVFGIGECVAKISIGRTISQDFWVFSQGHPKQAWIVLLCMEIAWQALLAHLSIKLWR